MGNKILMTVIIVCGVIASTFTSIARECACHRYHRPHLHPLYIHLLGYGQFVDRNEPFPWLPPSVRMRIKFCNHYVEQNWRKTPNVPKECQ